MLFIEILANAAILYLFLMFSILFHELGHLSGYKITIKSNDWIIQLGTGKELFSTKRLRYHAIPIGGAFLFEYGLKNKKEQLLMSAGGPIFTAILIILLFILQRHPLVYVSNDAIVWMRNYNLWILFFSLIPMKYPAFLGIDEVKVSDGMAILHALRNNNKDTKI
jgi:hypothetical protein